MRADELTRRLDAVEGRIGVVVEDAEGRTLFERDPEGEYPAASVIKLPLVMALFAEAARGAPWTCARRCRSARGSTGPACCCISATWCRSRCATSRR